MSPTLELLRLDGDPTRPPLLFLHGAWMGAWCWRDWMAFFHGHGHTVLAPSYRGHGASAGRERLRWTRLGDYVADAATAARTLPRPPIVVAHSLGGAVAQRLLETLPAQGLVLLSSVPPHGALSAVLRLARHHPLEFLRINLSLSLRAAISSPALVRELFFHAGTPEETILGAQQQMGDESYAAFLDLVLFQSRLRVGQLPVLVLGGESDGIIPRADLAVTARAYAATLKTYPKTGHNLMLEPNRLQIAADLLEWLRALP